MERPVNAPVNKTISSYGRFSLHLLARHADRRDEIIAGRAHDGGCDFYFLCHRLFIPQV